MNALPMLLGVAALAAVLTTAITPIMRRFAIARGYVSGASGDRWHSEPTPYLGGVAIFVGFTLALLVGFALVSPAALVAPELWPEDTGWRPFVALGAAGALMFAAGLWDDVRPLGPAAKLLAQVTAGAILVSGGVMVRLFGHAEVDILVSLFWFVGITNAMNLLDNMDGLAVGVVAIAASFLGVLFILDGLAPFALIAFTLAGAALGFLRHNAHPARIFMGDSGSLFLGIFLAGLALAPAPGLSRGLFGVLAIPLMVLAVPILDTTLVTAGRLAEGRPISRGGRDHASHRLVALGLPERKAVRVLWMLAAAGGTLGILLRTSERAYAYLVGGILVCALALFGAFLLRVGVGSPPAKGKTTRTQRLLAWTLERPVLAFVLDIGLFIIAHYTAYLLRWEPSALEREWAFLQMSLVLLIVTKATGFVLAGVYRDDWRFFGLPTFGRVLRGSLLGSLLFVTLSVFLFGPGLSRGVVIIDWVLTGIFASVARLSFRLFDAAQRHLDEDALRTLVVCGSPELPVMFAHLRTRSDPAIRPVAFWELSGEGRAKAVMGVPRYVGEKGLAKAVNERRPAAIVVALDTHSPIWEALIGSPELQGLPFYRLGVEFERVALPWPSDDATVRSETPIAREKSYAAPH